MTTFLSQRIDLPIVRSGLVVATVLAVLLSGAVLIAPARAVAPHTPVAHGPGTTSQWAFGGSASSAFSCSNANCFGGNYTPNGTFSLSWQYYIEWVVIYTRTNVSATQTQIEGQAAINASVKLSINECVPSSGSGGSCQQTSATVTVSGRAVTTGFTNITNGSVDLTASSSSPLGPTAALAVMDASSSEAFNFSGSYSFSGLSTGGGPTSGTVNFDFGASETSSVSFGTPLGVVPANPHPGDMWTASTPYSAHGSWSGGYSFSVSGYGSAGTVSNWTHGSVSPSGTLSVNGTDLGQYTLWDNYTNPPTSVTAQEILLDFGTGAFSASDGWVMIPTGTYSGIFPGGLHLAAQPAVVPHASPRITTFANSESAYYQPGPGFIGASATGNSSIPISRPGAASPTVRLTAGPEPVSVAEQQYQAITANPSSSASGFPWTWVVVGVVVVALAALTAVLLFRRRRPPAASMAPPGLGAPPSGPGPGPTPPETMATVGSATGPSAPPSGPMPPSPPAPSPAPVVCPRCGQPATFIAQYNRSYCFHDQRYV